MLQRIMQTCRQLARLAVKSARGRQSTALDVIALEERATPATGFLAAPVEPPVMYVVADLPAGPASAELAIAKPIVRVDLMPAVGSTKAHAAEWSDLIAAEPATSDFAGKAPVQKADEPAPPIDGTAEELALLEAEWAAMQQAS